MQIVIVGIHTGVGKTLCSTILCKALNYDYWKPVQAGLLPYTDTEFVEKRAENPTIQFFPEKFRLKLAASPHIAASVEGINIALSDFSERPDSQNLIIETAGGVMSPLSQGITNLDLITFWKLPVLIVTNTYLGSINHSLLTYEVLKQRNVPILGWIFSGKNNMASENYILNYSQLPHLFSIPFLEEINNTVIEQIAERIKDSIKNWE